MARDSGHVNMTLVLVVLGIMLLLVIVYGLFFTVNVSDAY